eukprot:744024-Prorocentrum_lima.AAC.1
MRQSVNIGSQHVDLRRWLHRYSEMVNSRLSGWKWPIQVIAVPTLAAWQGGTPGGRAVTGTSGH